jgi:hypothetical protein
MVLATEGRVGTRHRTVCSSVGPCGRTFHLGQRPWLLVEWLERLSDP